MYRNMLFIICRGHDLMVGRTRIDEIGGYITVKDGIHFNWLGLSIGGLIVDFFHTYCSRESVWEIIMRLGL